MSFDSPAYRKIDLSERSTQIISIPTQEEYIDQMVNAMRFFFGTGDDTYADLYSSTKQNFGFKGFVLAGPPGSGKTEAVTEAGRRLWGELAEKSIELKLLHISTADINRGRVGEMEQRLRSVFQEAKADLSRGIYLEVSACPIQYDKWSKAIREFKDQQHEDKMKGIDIMSLEQLEKEL
mgnify:CR=1 FL=1